MVLREWQFFPIFFLTCFVHPVLTDFYVKELFIVSVSMGVNKKCDG